MVADSALPVWTISPNWKNGVTERLEWLTDVLASNYGTEQRRALRLSPRRSFEMTFNPTNAARSYFDLWLHRLGSEEFMVPLWHDRGKLSAAIAAGATVIPVDTTYREFSVGDLAVLIGDDPFTFDKVEITGVAAGSLTVTPGGVTKAWGKNLTVYPLRRSRISQESLFSALTNRVGEATLQFELNQNNSIADEGAWTTLYSGVPILTDKPNRRENIDLTYNRNSLVLDNDVGLRTLLDDAGRAFTTQTYLMLTRGRAAHWAFRQMLYRLRGQASPVWLPTFNEDMVLARPRLAADAVLDVKKIGYAYTGGTVDGRKHILIGGSIGREITGVGGALAASEERLLLGSALGTALPAGASASFMDIVRQSQDAVEITHHTDTDGTSECNLAFKAFRDERTVDGPISYPIATSFERGTACGQVSQLVGLSWLLPCLSSGATCACSGSVEDSYTITDFDEGTHNVRFRVRGIVEVAPYSGGTVLTSHVRKDPSGFSSGGYNRYRLIVSNPPGNYYLNDNGAVNTNIALDYEVTIPIAAGATITLRADTIDSLQQGNIGNLSVADNDDGRPVVVAQPYNGQFLQMDMLEIMP